MAIDFRAILNKKTKQVTLSVPKKKMPECLKDILKKHPEKLKSIKLKFKGYDTW